MNKTSLSCSRLCQRTQLKCGPLPALTHRCSQDAEQALQLLQEAARQLRAALKFHRGDAEPMVALGEVLLAAADLHWAQAGASIQAE